MMLFSYNGLIKSRRRDGRVAEGARLESVYTLTGIVGSNPTLSAISSRRSFASAQDFGSRLGRRAITSSSNLTLPGRIWQRHGTNS
jgi:hypothetical protein